MIRFIYDLLRDEPKCGKILGGNIRLAMLLALRGLLYLVLGMVLSPLTGFLLIGAIGGADVSSFFPLRLVAYGVLWLIEAVWSLLVGFGPDSRAGTDPLWD